MKSLAFALVIAFALPLFAAPGDGPKRCNLCIQDCNKRAKTDAEAQACLTNCLRKPFCNSGGFGLLENISNEDAMVDCASESEALNPACLADQGEL